MFIYCLAQAIFFKAGAGVKNIPRRNYHDHGYYRVNKRKISVHLDAFNGFVVSMLNLCRFICVEL